MKTKFFCDALMSSKDIKILKYNWYQKSYKTASAIYVDLVSLVKSLHGCKSSSEN